MDFLNHLAQAHPYYFAVGSFLAGAAGPKLLSLLETEGVDYAVAELKVAMGKAGLSPEKIAEVEGHLANAAQRAADDFKKDAKA